MKKILMLTMCLALVPMLFAADIADVDPSAVPGHVFRSQNIGSNQYTGSRSTPTLVEVIDLTSVSVYCFGLTYDWERDALWVGQFPGTEPWVYCIQKTAPCTKIDSFQLVGGPGYFLGIGYAGGDVMYAMDFNGNVHEVDMTTGVVSFYRANPWPGSGIGCGFNTVDDVIYGADWGFDQCGYAQPAQTGTWNTWALSSACGASGAYGASSPEWLFTCNEDATQAQFFQHSLTAGIPNTTPDSTWECDPSQSMASTADCTFDGQYVYVLDQGDPDNIFVYDVGFGELAFWDFETGWQDWTHTSALVFPAAWDVWISGYKPAYTPPDAGDSTMWVDSDAAGSTGPWIQDTALSPILLPNSGMDWLKWGVGYYHLGSQFMDVGIKYFDGATWTAVPLVTYNATTSPRWDSADVSAYASYDSVQVYFYFDDADGWNWYAAFDNVSIGAIPYVSEHDVGSVAFLSPGLMVAPGDEDVIGVVRNFGNNDETYDVHCVVTDPSVVLDVTLNITTLIGESDTLNFGSVDFQDGNTYDIMMATLLAGDADPTNDTLTQSTYCTSVFWEILTDMPHTASGPYVGYSMDAASNTYVHVFGGNPSAQALHYIYDATNASWSAGTPLPTGATYGGYCSINNKIYMIGAWTAGPDALITIYDADTDLYTTVPIPTGNINDPGIAVKDNNLIYIVGGGPGGWTATTTVNLYDVAGDSFFTNVTQLPAADPKAFAGTAMITGDTIVVASGYGPTGSEDKVLFGAIDPANPANITWSTGPPYPGGATYRGSGDTWEGVGYFTCGSPALALTYAYVPGTGWVTLPDKPTGLMNVGFVMAAVDTSLVDDVEGYGFACGGYSPYMSTFEALHTGVITGIYEQPDDVPVAFTSRMISSNPVTDRAKIEFAMPHQGPVMFSIYDISGRRVLDSKYSSVSAGIHTILWSCEDNVGRDVPSGIYFYRLEAAGNVATGKLVIVQ